MRGSRAVVATSIVCNKQKYGVVGSNRCLGGPLVLVQKKKAGSRSSEQREAASAAAPAATNKRPRVSASSLFRLTDSRVLLINQPWAKILALISTRPNQ